MARYSTQFAVSGKIAAIYDLQMLRRGITYTDVLIETAADKDKYSNAVIVSFFGDKADELKYFGTGDMVEVSGLIQGRYSDQTNHYWTTLDADTIKRAKK